MTLDYDTDYRLMSRTAGIHSQPFFDGPHLDGAKTGGGPFRGNLDRFLERGRLEEKEAANLLLGFRERAVGHRDLAVPHAERRRRGRALKRLRENQAAAPLQRLDVVERFLPQRVPLPLRQYIEGSFLFVCDAEIFHLTPPADLKVRTTFLRSGLHRVGIFGDELGPGHGGFHRFSFHPRHWR